MELSLILGYIGAVFIGLILGLVGGGGSILSVPILVYLVGLSAEVSTGYSLFIVGTTSIVGAISYYRRGELKLRAGIIFAIPSIFAVYFSRKVLIGLIPSTVFEIHNYDLTADVFFFIFLSLLFLGYSIFLNKFRKNESENKLLFLIIPAVLSVFIMRSLVLPAIPKDLLMIHDYALTKDDVILILFSFIMVIAGISMVRKKKALVKKEMSGGAALLTLEGLFIGTLTGIVGAGGGFLIIPALVLFVGLPMKQAIGTSLMIIALKSLIGFLGDVGNHAIDWPFLLIFTSLSLLGIVAGLHFSKRINGEILKKGFGVFVIGMGLMMFIKQVL